ncbi:hypothetical protein FOMPIDRAFT_1056738 [Fomitopsis schrenkii]|uniref:Uncharacterized protein n=1 Tax=Fomitopsis schrenkii TaxID=2126942 RepID=S8DG68_FOMSC|nr:hypothetical protein FOMPIDRAFT_1056738 [Fomitopsis schrenkii]
MIVEFVVSKPNVDTLVQPLRLRLFAPPTISSALWLRASPNGDLLEGSMAHCNAFLGSVTAGKSLLSRGVGRSITYSHEPYDLFGPVGTPGAPTALLLVEFSPSVFGWEILVAYYQPVHGYAALRAAWCRIDDG